MRVDLVYDSKLGYEVGGTELPVRQSNESAPSEVFGTVRDLGNVAFVQANDA